MKRKFFCALFGEIELGQVYAWIHSLVKVLGYKNVEYDPVFDMVEVGGSVEIMWTERSGQHKMVSLERVA